MQFQLLYLPLLFIDLLMVPLMLTFECLSLILLVPLLWKTGPRVTEGFCIAIFWRMLICTGPVPWCCADFLRRLLSDAFADRPLYVLVRHGGSDGERGIRGREPQRCVVELVVVYDRIIFWEVNVSAYGTSNSVVIWISPQDLSFLWSRDPNDAAKERAGDGVHVGNQSAVPLLLSN